MKSNKKFLRIPLYLAAVFLLLAGGIALALSSGPVAVGWMAPLIRSAIEAASPAAKIDFTSPVIEWNDKAGSLDLSVTDVVIFGPGGPGDEDEEDVVKVTLPRVAVAISLNSLLEFSPAVKRIDLFEPEMEVVWSAAELRRRLQGMQRPTHLPPVRPQNREARPGDGNSSGPAAVADKATQPLAELPEAIEMARRLLDAPLEGEAVNPVLGQLESVRVHSANISIVESASDARWQIHDAQLELRRDQGGPRLIADVTLEAGGRSSRLVINTSAVDEKHRLIDLRLTDLDFGALAREVQLGKELKYIALPLSGDMRIDYVTGSGIERIAFELGAGKGEVDIPQLFAGPRTLDDMAVVGDFDLTEGLLRFESIYLAFAGAELNADAIVEFTGKELRRPDLKLHLAVSNLDIRTLVEYWPKRLGRLGHLWVDTNMPVGHIPEGSIEMHVQPYMWGMRPMPASAVRIDFRVENATAHYLKGMPPIEKGYGVGTFTTDELDIRISKAEVDGIPMGESRHLVDKVGYRGQALAHTTVRVEAPISDIMRLIDYPPLNYTTRYKLPVGEVSGRVEVVTELKYKPGKGLRPEDVEVLVEAQLSQLSYPTLMRGGGLTAGTLRMTLTRDGMISSGGITLNGADFHLNWTQDFLPERADALTARYELTGELSGADMLRFGVPAVPDILDRAHANLTLEGRGGELVQGVGHVDLATTGVNSKRLSWSKPAGTPGRVDFEMAWRDEIMFVENIVINSPGISTEASFSFDSETGNLLTSRVPSLKTSGHDLSVVSDFIDGKHKIRIDAQRFDARAWLDPILSGEDEPEPPMDIELTAEHVMTMNGIAMSDVKLTMVNDGDYWSSASAGANMDDGGSFDLGLFEDDNGRHLTLLAEEAGRLALGFGVFRNGSGGRLSMDAQLNLKGQPSHVSGEMNIRDFSVVKSSSLAKAIVARTGQDVDKYLGDGGFSFRRFKFPFTFEKGVVDISDARANGPRIGFTMRGQANRASGEINVDGIIVPAYAFNSLLGNIPLVGGLLTGGKGGGLFALTYQMKGSMSAPDITINPLSALAPGFLRKIFEGNKGKVEPEAEAEKIEPEPETDLAKPGDDEVVPQG